MAKAKVDYRWEWIDANDEWHIYDESIQKILDTEHENDKSSAKFSINGNQFEVIFASMIQKTIKTGYERPIRYCLKCDDDVNKDYFTWQWQDDNKHWVYYMPNNVCDLEKEYNKPNNNFDLKITSKLSYEINFNTMKQTNKKTKFSRSIKRVKSECKSSLKKEDADEVKSDTEVDDRPSRNLRKRKSATASNVADDDSDDEKEANVKRKKAALKKETSSSSTESKKSSKKSAKSKIEVKEEVIEIKEENEVEDENDTKSNKNGKLKKAESKAEESDDSSSMRSTRNKKSTAKNIKKEKIEEEEEEEEVKEGDDDSSSKRSTRGKKSKDVKKEKIEEEDDDDAESHVSKSQANFEKKVQKEKKTDNVKTLKFTGKIPLDEQFMNSVGTDFHIYSENDVAYDCMLNQTNLQFNNNKYYLLQLVERNKTKSYGVWFRWGRVGKTGQTSYDDCGTDLERAKTIFCRKFYDKTKNEWDYKDEFEKVPGKYDLVQKDYDAGDEDKVKKEAEETEEKPNVPESKLDKRLQDLMNLICNIQDMEDMLKELKYDTKKAPLGKLSANQIKAGYAALKKIEAFINEDNFGSAFINACNEFYTRIPHDFGMRVPTPIRTKQLLKEKLQLLEALADIEVAVKMLNQKSDIENPVDRSYKQLECDLKPLDANDKMYKLISDYLQKTHAPTHCTYKMKLLDIFEVHKQNEHDRFNNVGNRMLLWHGSRTTNWAGILSQGLKIAPPEAPVTGYMFGKGCYFADVSSKSANYCYTSKNKNIGIISLSEVALGECNELLHDDYHADKLPAKKSSTKGLGKSEPNPKQWIKLDDGVIMPIGDIIPTGANNPKGYTLLYNEYVVYDVSQIKTRYIVKIEFDYD